MKIPTSPYYDIDENGVVRLISSGEIVPEYINYRKKRAVRIREKSHKPRSCNLDRLMLITYKPPGKDKNPDWLSVRFVDGNKDNISIDNLEWDETWWHPVIIPGITVPRDAWIIAYGYPDVQFRITDERILFRSSSRHNEIGVHEYSDTAYSFIITPDKRERIPVHRIVALTLLPHPQDVDHLVVNHRDSDKTNNDFHNLEWATYSENNYHAYNEGPRSETVRKIRLKSVETGEEVVVAGYQEMSRHIGDTPQGVHQAITRRVFEGRPYKGYFYKYEDDPRTWEELEIASKVDGRKIPSKIAMANLLTGDEKIYTDFRQMLKEEGIRDYALLKLLNSPHMVPWKGKCFQEVVEGKELHWPVYPTELICAYMRTNATDRPIQVTGPNLVTEYYASATEWCMEDRPNRCDPAVLTRKLVLADKKDEILEWRDWAISHVDLGDYPLT